MGGNFHTPFQDGVQRYNAADMNPPASSLDRAVTYLKNVMVHYDDQVKWFPDTGHLVWTGYLWIFFASASGLTVRNKVAPGNVQLGLDEFAYVDLSEEDGAVLTVAAAAIAAGSASNFIAYNRVVLGLRNAVSDGFFPVCLRPAWTTFAEPWS